ncbi:MAG: hypothetical protein RDU25_01965 [Patescibacteria group bacterium]|nr:hypothetical protein [Patescibacteria group bacterium]
MHELAPTLRALAKAGGTTDHAAWMRSGEKNAAKLIQFIEEQRFIIDCDEAPYIPKGWEIRPEDQLPGAVGGLLKFDPSQILLHLEEGQMDGRTIVGFELDQELLGKPLLKANVLDHLLVNTNLIPEAWKVDEHGRARFVYFWGTIYRDSDGDLYVRCLCWSGSQWDWNYDWLGDGFEEQNPAAILAS